MLTKFLRSTIAALFLSIMGLAPGFAQNVPVQPAPANYGGWAFGAPCAVSASYVTAAATCNGANVLYTITAVSSLATTVAGTAQVLTDNFVAAGSRVFCMIVSAQPAAGDFVVDSCAVTANTVTITFTNVATASTTASSTIVVAVMVLT
jgi:hypothetical protein